MAKKESTHKRRGKQRQQGCPQELQDLLVFPFPCPNCDAPFKEPKLFCSDLCRDEAKYVRYYRECKKDGRIKKPDVAEALRIRRAHILSGGYNEKQRQLSLEVRQAVIARDKRICRKCGGIGIQIDHIKGDGNELDNLQLLCAKCHNEKAISSFITIDEESHPEAYVKGTMLDMRVNSKLPERVCDRPDWDETWKDIWEFRRILSSQAENGECQE